MIATIPKSASASKASTQSSMPRVAMWIISSTRHPRPSPSLSQSSMLKSFAIHALAFVAPSSSRRATSSTRLPPIASPANTKCCPTDLVPPRLNTHAD